MKNIDKRSKPWCPNGCNIKIGDVEFIKSFNLAIENMAIRETVCVPVKCPVCKNQIMMLISLEPTFSCWFIDEKEPE